MDCGHSWVVLPFIGLIFHKVLPVTHPNCKLEMKFFGDSIQKIGNLKINLSMGLIHLKSTCSKKLVPILKYPSTR